MSETRVTTPADEIDLLALFNKIFRAVNQYKILFISLLLLGILGGGAAFFFIQKRYEVRMLADSRVLTSKEVIEIMDGLQSLIKKGDRQLLAEKLHLSQAIVNKVHGFRTESSTDVVSDNNKDAFVIQAVVYDASITDSLQKGLVYYLENSEYVRQRTMVQRENLLAIKKRSEIELAQLDSVKSSIQNLLRQGGKTGNAFVIEPGNINEQSIKIYEKIRGLEELLRFLDNIQVISGFDKPNKSDFPKLPVCILVGLILGLILSLAAVLSRKAKS